jgi:hypothetical protein
MYKILEKWATDDFRSVNGQIEWILDRAIKEAGRKGPNEKPNKTNTKKN